VGPRVGLDAAEKRNSCTAGSPSLYRLVPPPVIGNEVRYDRQQVYFEHVHSDWLKKQKLSEDGYASVIRGSYEMCGVVSVGLSRLPALACHILI
jgi:hypothetical protein